MEHLPTIYAAAVLLPLASFVIILLFAKQLGQFASWVATSAILGAGILSFLAFGLWLASHFPEPAHHDTHPAAHDSHQKSEVRTQKSELPLTFVAKVQEAAVHADAAHAPGPAVARARGARPRDGRKDRGGADGVSGRGAGAVAEGYGPASSGIGYGSALTAAASAVHASVTLATITTATASAMVMGIHRPHAGIS